MSGPVFSPRKRKPFVAYSEPVTQRTTSGGIAEKTWPDDVEQALIAINVTALAGTSPSVTVTLQQKDTNGNWQNAESTSALTAVGKKSLTTTGMLVGGGNWRLWWDLVGTSADFQLSVIAR